MKTLKRAFALFVLTGFFLALSVNLFADVSCARADFATWADRTTRPTEPVGYDVYGTSVQKIVAWNGTGGIGNLGIGTGDISLMKPDVINAAIKNSTAGLHLSGDNPAGNRTPVQRNVMNASETPVLRNVTNTSKAQVQRNVTNASETPASDNVNATSEAEAQDGAAEEWESLLPEHVAAASFITAGEPYSITINQPYPHILNEEPNEPGVLYAKMLGLPLPGGRVMDMGIKSLGTEF